MWNMIRYRYSSMDLDVRKGFVPIDHCLPSMIYCGSEASALTVLFFLSPPSLAHLLESSRVMFHAHLAIGLPLFSFTYWNPCHLS